ncbi:hypothetical protein ET495_05935 [Xylanimonas allomyrinae]|uniref:Transcriptional regulator HTH-type FeoC domain-containing protein n=1 Tax=Xylanimonas allomyrinae TaxID=2509459 RepID=A0A4V0YE38_9MICO|nr:hypothetical protein [Xylanimonas allomyrinae]QAY62861.1 hypothetical protein ET495_05935 [Xylanimonas allomyrinae]
MSVLTDVLDAVRRGVPGERLGAYLGVDDGLAELALDHWVRLGIVTPAGDLHLGCTACSGLTGTAGTQPTQRPPGCGGCPFSR